MKAFGKQIWSTVVVISVLVGIISGWPVVQKMAQSLPTWLNDPYVWWSVVWLGVGAVVLVYIWTPRRENARKSIVPSEFRLVNLIFNSMQLATKKLAIYKKQPDDYKKMLFQETHIHMPALLDMHFGKKAKDEFDEAISTAEKLSENDPACVFDAYSAHIGSFCVSRASKLVEKAQKELAESRSRLIELNQDTAS